MQFIRFLCLLFIAFFFFNCAQKQKSIKNTTTNLTQLFKDSGTKNWQENWFLDGKKARVKNSHLGMEFSAGNEFGNDSCHAVLWTKNTFTGNFRLSYEYTRTDTVTRCVNILYFLATGKGTDEFPEDIYLWNHKREVPKMKVYFNHMNTYHISYSAFDAKKYSGENDYIRFRKYNPTQLGLENTDIGSDYFNTGLFKTNIMYKISVEKRDSFVTMTITNPENSTETLHCKWDISDVENLTKGRIGFRHMYTRSAIYKNIEVFQLE